MNRLPRIAFWIGLLGPAAAILILVLRFGVNVPFWDDWELARPLIRLTNGSLPGWTELASQHNEHRMLFPRLVMLALAYVSRWNVHVNMVVSVALAGMSLAMLVALARPILAEAGAVGRAWAALTLSAIVFSLTQWENWLWGWQVQWFLAVLGAIAAIAFATWSLRSARPWACLAGAAGAAFVCQYSIASGAAIWACVVFVLAFHPLRRRVLPAMLAVAAAAIALYLIGYSRPLHHPSPLVALERPLAFLTYLGNYASGPLGRDTVLGLGAMAAFLALALIALRRFRTAPELVVPWIAMGAFAGANAVLTGIGRVGFGADQGFMSRYVTVSLLLSVALVPLGMLAFRAWPADRWPTARTIAAVFAAGLMTVLVAWADLRAWAGFTERSTQMVENRRCLLLIERATDECLKLVYPDPLLLRLRIKQLQAIGWSGFPKDPARPRGTIRLKDPEGLFLWRLKAEDSPVGWIHAATLDNGRLTVTGWAHHPHGNLEETRKVLVAADGVVLGEAEIVGERPDVAAVFKDASFLRTGWTLQVEAPPAANRLDPLQAYLLYGEDVLIALEGYAKIEAAR